MLASLFVFGALDGDAMKTGEAHPAGAARFPSSVRHVPERWLPAGLSPRLSHEVQALTLSSPADLTLNQCLLLLQILK